MAMEYFQCYHSYLKKTAKLSDQEVGRLFRALLKYSATGERQELTGREDIAFDFIADDIDRAKAAYEEKCRVNAEHGRKGGTSKTMKRTLANGGERYQTLANASERGRTGSNSSESSQGKDEDEDEGKDEGKNKDKHTKETGSEAPHKESVCDAAPQSEDSYSPGFRAFWGVYPRKTDKAMAYKMYCARLKDGYTPDELLTAARLYADECHKDKRDPQYIKLGKTFLGPSTPFADYLGEDADDEYFPPSPSDEDVEQYKKFLEDTGQCQTV